MSITIQRPQGTLQNLTKTAFGELAVESKTPQVQIKFPYGVIDDIGQILTNKVGSAITDDQGNAVVTADGSAQSFAQIRTRKILRYGPGQGGLFLGTCVFSPGVANSTQVIGPGDDDQGYFWGFNGTSFGVLRRFGGSLEMKQLTITAGATNSGNITITLDGSPVVVAVTAGDTIAQVTAKIVAAQADFLNAGRGWETHTDDNISIEFLSLVAENAAGAFTFTDTGGTLVTANPFTELVNGVAPTESWVALDSGDPQIVDPLDGSGPSGMTIDTTKGNVFYIRFQYLGYGAIEYGVENPATGLFIPAVRLRYANANVIPSLENVDNPISIIAKTETGYTGGDLVMRTASMASFLEGETAIGGVRRSASATKSVSTTETPVLILHNEIDFNGKINKISVAPDLVSFGTESPRTTILRIVKEPSEITGGGVLTDVDPGVSVMQFATAGTGVIGGRELLQFVLPSGSGYLLNLVKEELQFAPGERIVITARHTGGAASDVSVSFSWNEGI